MSDPVVIYTDGACSGNPGPGGWGVLMTWKGHDKTLQGGEAHTTNNRMEMLAAIEALSALKRPVPVVLHTDSTYLRDGITRWIKGWKRNGWRTRSGGEVKNADLWRRLDALQAKMQIEWRWVRGHAGNAGNEQADALARAGLEAHRRG